MSLSNPEAERIVRSGVAALQRGDPRAAAAAFEQVAASGRAGAPVWLLLAHAHRATGDAAAEEAALDALLAIEPGVPRGLIMKGDRRAAAGDARAASSFYKKGLNAAAAASEPLPADLQEKLVRVRAWLDINEGAYREHLEREMAKRFPAAGRSRRFQQSLDILFGEKQACFQRPTSYFFPELPQIQFYERSLFPWVEALEAATTGIKEELLALMRSRELFQPYLVAAPDRPRSDFHGLLDNPKWSSLYLWENGRPVEENAARCPVTFAALEKVPLPRIGVRAPVVMFSWLQAGARIPPHNGAMNARLICHLPLIVPSGCGFRVGNEVRAWEPGKLLIFDDTIEHEAWNDSDEDRVVLIFDIWRPELDEAERAAVAAMFEAVDSFPGTLKA